MAIPMDMNKIREEDAPYVKEVVDYLENLGLTVELDGGATRGDKEYQDVDLRVTGDDVQVTDAYSGLLGMDGRTTPLPKNAEDDTAYIVTLVGEQVKYTSMRVDYRFKIYAEHTEIDVNLRAVRPAPSPADSLEELVE